VSTGDKRPDEAKSGIEPEFTEETIRTVRVNPGKKRKQKNDVEDSQESVYVLLSF
jgi:hypothetical protein